MKIAIVEDLTVLRDLLKQSISRRFPTASVSAFGQGVDGVTFCLAEKPDLLLVDLFLPDLGGIDIVKRVRGGSKETKLMVLTAFAEEIAPAELIGLGVTGFLDKNSSIIQIEDAVETVLAGGMFFAATSCRASPPTGAVSSTSLTDRQREVARLVAAGLTSKEIARRLELSVRTVENHRAMVMDRLGLRDTASLIRWCMLNGLS